MAKADYLKQRTYLEARVFSQQLLRAGTSVAANYRAACRGRSRREFAAKLGTVIEEADEAESWLAATRDLQIVTAPEVESLRVEADELVAIFTQAYRTASAPDRRPPGPVIGT